MEIKWLGNGIFAKETLKGESEVWLLSKMERG